MAKKKSKKKAVVKQTTALRELKATVDCLEEQIDSLNTISDRLRDTLSEVERAVSQLENGEELFFVDIQELESAVDDIYRKASDL